MILFDPSSVLPAAYRRRFRHTQGALLAVFVLSWIFAGYSFLFPSQHFRFSHDTPEALANTLEKPVGTNGESLEKGRLDSGNTFRTFAGTVGDFSSADVRLSLRKDSPIPSTLTISLRRSYRSFFLPVDEVPAGTDESRVIAIDGTPYLFSQETISPLISDAAALSWSPKEKVLPANTDIFSIFPPAESPVGFRPGSLLSDARGVFAIDGDGSAHPIGSTEIFEALGFAWDNVTAVNEEELGIHPRGRMFGFDSFQPDGTLFLDRSDGHYTVVSGESRHPIDNREHIEILRSLSTPIEADGRALSVSARCDPKRLRYGRLSRTISCSIPLDSLADLPGGSYELSVAADQNLHLKETSLTLRTALDRENLSLFLRRLKERFMTVYGNV